MFTPASFRALSASQSLYRYPSMPSPLRSRTTARVNAHLHVTYTIVPTCLTAVWMAGLGDNQADGSLWNFNCSLLLKGAAEQVAVQTMPLRSAADSCGTNSPEPCAGASCYRTMSVKDNYMSQMVVPAAVLSMRGSCLFFRRMR